MEEIWDEQHLIVPTLRDVGRVQTGLLADPISYFKLCGEHMIVMDT